MQQSRLDKFFTTKKSATKLVDNADGSNDSTTSNQQTNKRLATTDNENNKKLKRTKSDTNSIEDSSQSNENNFSLNQFYLDKFLLILSSLLKHHKCLFDENELILFDKFQTLSGLCLFLNL
jgi:hypothetical protein